MPSQDFDKSSPERMYASDMIRVLFFMIVLGTLAFRLPAVEWQQPRLFKVMTSPASPQRVQELEKQIREGADVNAPILFDRRLRTGEDPATLKGTSWPLDMAVQQADVDAVNLLLAKGAKTHGMELPIAALRGKPEQALAITTALLEHGADVNGRHDGFTALFWASSQGKKEIVALLLARKGIKLDVVSDDGDTALMAAARHGHVEIVQKLVQAGADVKAANERGETASTLAQKNPEKLLALLAVLEAAPK